MRSITLIVLSAIALVASAGSILLAAVTSASDSSGEIATLIGGPTTLVGTFDLGDDLRRRCARSIMVTVSGGGLATTLLTPLSSIALLSLADTAIWAWPACARAVQANAAQMERIERDMVSLLVEAARGRSSLWSDAAWAAGPV